MTQHRIRLTRWFIFLNREMREISRSGARFTWSNRHLNHVRCVLDRVFFSLSLDSLFPLTSLVAESSLGSDHTPLILDLGVGSQVRSNRFFFETGWFEFPDFALTVQTCWDRLSARVGGRDIIDWWSFMSGDLRQHLKGWSRNMGGAAKVEKAHLLEQIKELDALADSAGLDGEGWAFRYNLEEQILQLLRVEEEYWR